MSHAEQSRTTESLGCPGRVSIFSVGALVRQCVSALSKRFSSESICDPLYGDTSTHREAWALGGPTHAWAQQDSPLSSQKDPQDKFQSHKSPTSILRRRSNLTGSSPKVPQSRKSDRRVHFSDPEFTVHTYCAPPGHTHLKLLTWALLVLSALMVFLLCTCWRRSQSPKEVFRSLMGEVLWGSLLWLTMQ